MDKSLILNKLRDHKNFKSEADFARYLNITPQNLSKWRERNTYKIDILSMKYPDVNIEWLLTGEGEMLKSTQKEEMPPKQETQGDVTMSREVFELLMLQQKTLSSQQEAILSQQVTQQKSIEAIALLSKQIAVENSTEVEPAKCAVAG